MIIDDSVMLTTSLMIALIVLIITLISGLGRAIIGPSVEDRFSSLLLLGSGGVALILLLAILLQMPVLYDVALVLAMLAVVMTVAVSRRLNNHD
jgi:multicomponent Na+:H+ antiporter subunit F